MSGLTGSQVDDLLRQAEERLSNGSTTGSATDKVKPSQDDAHNQPQLAELKEKLSLRLPQKSTATTKVRSFHIITQRFFFFLQPSLL